MEKFIDEDIIYFTDNELVSVFNQFEKRVNEGRDQNDYAYKLAVRNRALFYTMYYCALRVGEVLDIKVDYLNTDERTLHCRRSQNSISNTLKIVDDKVYQTILTHIEVNRPTEYLFSGINNGNKLTRINIDAIMKGNSRKNIDGIGYMANVPEDKWNCTTFRHTRAMELVSKGLELRELNFWLGHSRIDHTVKYYNASNIQVDEKRLYNKLI